MVNIKHFYFNLFRSHCMVLWKDSKEAVIVDPGAWDREEMDRLEGCFALEGLKPCAIILTHCHFDHIYGVKQLKEKYNIPVYLSDQDRNLIKELSEDSGRFKMPIPVFDFQTSDIQDGQILSLGGIDFEVMTTPGHSPGSVCYYIREEKILLTGDTLFRGAIGRTDLIGADYDKEIVSIMDKIMALDGDVEIFPGHGGNSTLSWERTNNPFLEPFNEPEPDNEQ